MAFWPQSVTLSYFDHVGQCSVTKMYPHFNVIFKSFLLFFEAPNIILKDLKRVAAESMF